MNNIRHGRQSILVESIKVEETKETGTATISYTQQGTIETVRSNTPPYKSRSELIPAAFRLETKAIETTGTGTSCKVTLTYKIAENEDSSSDGFTLGREKERTFKEDRITSKASILLHPKFDSVPELHKILAKAFLDGVVPYDLVFVLKQDSQSPDLPVFRTSVTKSEALNYDTMSFKEAVDKFIQKGKHPLSYMLFQKILAGVTEYNTSHRTRTHTDFSTRPGSGRINVICYPPGVNSGSWLRTSQTSSFDSETGIYTITTVYDEADAGAVWDPDLYESELSEAGNRLR